MAKSSKGGGNPRVVDTSLNRKEGISGMQAQAGQAGGYVSNESKGGAVAGIRDTSGGSSIQELRRSAPNVGVYQSGNNNRGGAATRNYDSSTDKSQSYMAPGLEELRAKQDRASGRGGKQND